MATSILEQYQVADLLEWYRGKRLRINEDFQRRSVWTQSAKVYLIDTILEKLPIPKLYLRQRVDVRTQTSYREVVDGQQRLRAIVEFADDRLRLTRRSQNFASQIFSTLPEESQEDFLSYAVGVEQLLNASDNDVLEVFARLNSYTVALNHQELRHAAYQGEFKWTVHEASRRWTRLWDEYRVVSVRERVRMLDDQLMAEMYGFLTRGLASGRREDLDKLYRANDAGFSAQERVKTQVDRTVEVLLAQLEPVLCSAVGRGPHFLMLFAATAHALFGLPTNEKSGPMPERDGTALSNPDQATRNLHDLASIIELTEQETGELGHDLKSFWHHSHTTTQAIQSRKARLPLYYAALLPRPLGT